MFLECSLWPSARSFSASSAPEVSVSAVRVSETVTTARLREVPRCHADYPPVMFISPNRLGMILVVEIMPLRFEVHGRDDGGLEIVEILFAVAQYRTQIHRMLVAEAEQQTSFDGNADPIAIGAEVVRNRRDEADPRLGADHLRVTRRSSGFHGAVEQRVAAFDLLPNPVVAADRLFAIMIGSFAERHFLDEGDIEAAVEGVFHQRQNFFVVAAAHDNRVDAQAVESRGDGGIDSGQHAFELADPGDSAEFLPRPGCRD